MSKKWCDWSDLFKGKTGEPESALSRPVEKDCHKGGDKVTKEDLQKDADKILNGFKNGTIRQATDRELFGHLEVTEKQEQELQKKFNNFFNDYFKEVNKPIDDGSQESEWGNGRSFNSMLSEEEIAERNMCVGSLEDIE